MQMVDMVNTYTNDISHLLGFLHFVFNFGCFFNFVAYVRHNV